MKEQIIQLPDNFEVKEIKDGKIILVEKEKKLTYKDVADKMFPNGKNRYYISGNSDICEIRNFPSNYKLENNCTSSKQAEKLLAINKLMNVAKYLNEGWQPDWEYMHEDKYYIYIDNDCDKVLQISSVYDMQSSDVYFKSKELAQQAIEILGEETIRLALCTDY